MWSSELLLKNSISDLGTKLTLNQEETVCIRPQPYKDVYVPLVKESRIDFPFPQKKYSTSLIDSVLVYCRLCDEAAEAAQHLIYGCIAIRCRRFKFLERTILTSSGVTKTTELCAFNAVIFIVLTFRKLL